jgi:peroxiredoxin
VIHLRSAIAQVAADYKSKGISFVAISSNDVINYPEDSPEKMKEVALASGFSFPYLYDETQAVAKAFEAACTPDIFVFDNTLKLAYRGQFDDSRPSNNIAADGKDLRKALDDLLAGRSPHPLQKPSIGCNIKWKTI